ncbi:dihydropteroate synthase [Streptosporangium sp. NBC_01810]|uniref:dihydropteroate synthase n=1 Tax=Streptosporangium sp. NBC_01810 TaxID=2975951 RepID=UPI002DD9FFFC|nr:dihydropteroate synthase [Streptosporangium sp. NBC_01810]WSA24602.1 dihydropteroate synthase [Streptosporangium sp. NBC_01810]
MAAELMGVAQRRGAGFGTRTPDSFYDRGVTFAREQALRRVEEVVAEGADIVDIGGVKAAPGVEVGVAEEIDRTAAFVAEIRERYPDLIISVDTWHSLEVTRRLAELVATGWPVLVSLSNKDFVGESLGLPVDQCCCRASRVGASPRSRRSGWRRGPPSRPSSDRGSTRSW